MPNKTYIVKIGSVRVSGKSFTKGKALPATVNPLTIEGLLEKGYVEEFAPLSKPDAEPGIKITKKEVKAKAKEKPKSKTKAKPKEKEVVEETAADTGDSIDINVEDLTK